MTNSIVSVVISTYNRPKKLLAAIRSVQNQDYDNWELIVIGDGCDEETQKVFDNINDKRVLYFDLNKNHGLQDHGSTPKNIGIGKSSGNYIAYLDDDDEYEKSHLRESICFLENNRDVDLVYGCSKVYKFIQPERYVVRDRDFNKEEHDKSPFINTCEIVHRRSLLNKMEAWWLPVGYYNDYDFLKRVSCVGKIFHSKHIAASQHFCHDRIIQMERSRVRRRGKSYPKISVVVCVRGREKYLKECIKRLYDQTASKDDYEVIIANQGHGEETAHLTSLFAGRILHFSLNDEGPFHRGWVCNFGARTAIGDVLCFLDCDCLVRKDFIEYILNLISMEQDSKFMLRLKRKWLPEEETLQYFSGDLSFEQAYLLCGEDPNTNAIGSGFCVSRNVFFDIRGFDENFNRGWGFEDVDLSDRLLAFGCRNIIAPELLQMHLWHHEGSHERIHRGEHFVYYKHMAKLKERDLNRYLIRNDLWGEI